MIMPFNIKQTAGWFGGISAAGAFALLASVSNLEAGGTFADSLTPEPRDSSFADWWNGKYFTGEWFGLRKTLDDNGLKFGGRYNGAFWGVVDSQGGSRGFYGQSIDFSGELNFGKILKVEELEGLRLQSLVRWRDHWQEANPNSFVGANSMFNPSAWVSGMQWRLTVVALEYATKDLLPVKDMFVLRGGWLQPNREFIDQPLSKLFLNNAVNSSKGIGGNIPFSSSFTTWGGTLNVKPVDWHYVKGGLFMSYPRGTDSNNHGLAFQGYGPDPSQNGLMAMLETGFTPNIGAAELPGKYAMGGYYYGTDRPSFFGTPQYGQYGFYWQADQMLFRESSPYVEEPAPTGKDAVSSSSKSFKSPVSYSKPKLSDQGLSTFNLVTFAPKYNNIFPFYFQSGLVYKGLIPGRDKDQTMFSVAYGSYSYYSTVARQNAGRAGQDYTMFLEGGYRFQLNEWAFIQPFTQYVIRPNGTDNVQNAFILGTYFALTF
jgi:porin